MLRYSLSTGCNCRPRKIRFGILSTEEVRRLSVCKVTETVLYYRGLPASGGLLDPLMGSMDKRLLCATCMHDSKDCQGHPGHIELPYPVYHIAFLDTVLKALRIVCFACSRPICEMPDGAEFGSRQQHFQAACAKAKGKKRCCHCNMPQPEYAKVGLGIECKWRHNTEWESPEEEAFCKTPFTSKTSLGILENIEDDDVRAMGLDPRSSHPKNMVLDVVVVPPNCTRPVIYSTEGSRSKGQSDLTVRLLEILKRATELKSFLAANRAEGAEFVERLGRLQYEVSILFHPAARVPKPPGMMRVVGGQFGKSISERLKGKEGRVRGNLMGKRVDFSARCVISPDPCFDCDRVGVPFKVAHKLTVPETVTMMNIVALARRVKQGAASVHGALNVITQEGVVTTLHEKADVEIKVGDVVERFLSDDDVIIMNRQPSLHKYSMQAHRVKLMPGSTFRLSLSLTSPYNADFDGDEMNAHVPQSQMAASEARALLAICNNVIGSQGNKPTLGIVQDSLVGAYLMTRRATALTRGQFCRLVAATSYAARETPPPAFTVHNASGAARSYWTGAQAFSSLIPQPVHIEATCEDGSDWEEAKTPLVVRRGRMLCGRLTKRHLGRSPGSLIDVICREINGASAVRFISDTQRMINAFLLQHAHHVGIHDVMLPAAGRDEVQAISGTAMRLCEAIQAEMSCEMFDRTDTQAGERSIARILSKMLIQAGGVVGAHMRAENSLCAMVDAGSKGSFINLSQICAMLGQQSLEGSRIRGGECLSCFDRSSRRPTLQSCALVTRSFGQGLSATDLFFHAMGGREGLVDTAVKTSQCGYISRRLNKSMENNVVDEGGMVRNVANKVISFRWGSDGMHPARLERVKLRVIETGTSGGSYTEEEAARMEPWLKEVRRVKQHACLTEWDCTVLLPFNPSRVCSALRSAAAGRGPEANRPCEGRLDELLACTSSTVVKLAVADTLRGKNVDALPQEAYDGVVDKMKLAIQYAHVCHAEGAGCIAAQSIGEPATQMTLNSVDWKTAMAIHWTGNSPPPAPHDAEVGAFVDALIEERAGECQLQADGRTIYLPLPAGSAVALSPTESGELVWTELEAVTRHPPINKDGSSTLVEVTTESGRKVTVTKGKSLLVERKGRLVEMDGDEVNVGDRVPVVEEMPGAEGQETLNLQTVFKETEVVFTNTMIEAMQAVELNRDWFMKGEFKGRCCYARSDTMRDAVKKRPALTEPDKVVLPTGGNMLPMRIPLDREFGFFVGAYLAEGCVTDHKVHISNVDAEYRNAARAWPDKNGVHHHVTDEKHRGTSISIMFHSTILAQLLVRTCGKMSAGKRVPGFALAAPDEFVRGLLDGYISGDGSLSARRAQITAYSRSQKLRDGIALLLARFGIGCTLTESAARSHVEWKTEEDGSRTQTTYGERAPMYGLYVGAQGAVRFAEEVGLALSSKRERCNRILEEKGGTRGSPPSKFASMRSVRLEPIVALTDVDSSHEFVYDLTVAGTRNMTSGSGLAVRDTFHSSGIASKNATLGLPRLKELLDATPLPALSCTTLYMCPPFHLASRVAGFLSATLPVVHLSDLVEAQDILFEPTVDSVAAEDADLVRTHARFEELCSPSHAAAVRSLPGCASTHRYSHHVFRVVLKRDFMLCRLLDPPSVAGRILSVYGHKVRIERSEAFDATWVVRVRFLLPEGWAAVEQKAEQMLCYSMHLLLLDLVVSGCGLVSACSASKETCQRTGSVDHVVNVYGNGILSRSYIYPFVDASRCSSTNVAEVNEALGIEAAVHVLFQQLKIVVSFDGTVVDDRHILMICDTMARGGVMMPLNRHGLNRSEGEALMKCSFEETADMLSNAAVYAEEETAEGVTASIMTGQTSRVGTGASTVLISPALNMPCMPCNDQGACEIWQSTCRSFVSQPDVQEDIVNVLAECCPKKVSDADSFDERPLRKRRRFRPISPNPL